MRLIPVIDVLDGVVVRGIGGRRAEYKPLVSRLTDSTDPVEVARVLIERFRPAEIYVADLDAITGKPPAWPHLLRPWSRDAESSERSASAWWIDAGVRNVDDALPLAEAGIDGIICGLETLAGQQALKQMVEQLGPERLIFSVDLKHGKPLGDFAAWENGEAAAIVRKVVEMGIQRVIVLDLADVGEGRGVGTLALCRAISAAHPGLEIIAGGGVRGLDDLEQLEDAGVAGALAASALHNGRLG